MSVVSLRKRLEGAISKLPEKPSPASIEQIEAQITANGGNPEAIWEWINANPDATQLERVMFCSQHVRLHANSPNADIKPWTERQALKFLAWQAEQEQSNRYWRPNK